ncbi:MAG: 3-deoxy-D-manno-octulosonic acid transferase [Planktomarina sp.]
MAKLWAKWRYAALTTAIAPIAPLILKKRIGKGKEHPTRWREKLGYATAARPKGTLVWLHGVGLGEVLSARPMIAALAQLRPDLQFLVTSSTRVSADVFAAHAPQNVIHQFAPIDTPFAIGRFLNHWKPDLAVWIEQDVWPGLVFGCQARGIPCALINGRMHGAAAQKRSKAAKLYQAVYGSFDVIAAQDAVSAENLRIFHGSDVPHYPNLKSIAPPLNVDKAALEGWQNTLKARAIWTAGSAHMADTQVALEAHKALLEGSPDAVLAVLPRFPEDIPQITQMAQDLGLQTDLARNANPAQVLIEDRFGQSGLWYSLANTALIGGGFDDTDGHNPWEAIHMGGHVIHGPNTENFADDYAVLEAHDAAHEVTDAQSILAQLAHPAAGKHDRAVAAQKAKLAPLFDQIAGLLKL